MTFLLIWLNLVTFFCLKEILGKTPVAVISSGAKSILDIGKTQEVLNSQGVNTAVYQQDNFPAFFVKDSGFKANIRLDTTQEVARLIHNQFNIQNINKGVIIGNPIPKHEEADGIKISEAIENALKMADEQKILGAEITPFLLKTVNELTKGKSSESNIGLIKHNAKLGALVANELSQLVRNQTADLVSDKKPRVGENELSKFSNEKILRRLSDGQNKSSPVTQVNQILKGNKDVKKGERRQSQLESDLGDMMLNDSKQGRKRDLIKGKGSDFEVNFNEVKPGFMFEFMNDQDVSAGKRMENLGGMMYLDRGDMRNYHDQDEHEVNRKNPFAN